MDARNTKTGEIVENFNFSHEYGTVSYIDSKGLLRFGQPKDGEWEIIKPKFDPKDWMTKGQIIVDESKWSVFRREAASRVLAGMVSERCFRTCQEDKDEDDMKKLMNTSKRCAFSVLAYVDALIAELRKDETHRTLDEIMERDLAAAECAK